MYCHTIGENNDFLRSRKIQPFILEHTMTKYYIKNSYSTEDIWSKCVPKITITQLSGSEIHWRQERE